jgi:hypothetical protein
VKSAILLPAVLAAIALAGLPAQARDKPSAAADTATADADKKICRREAAATGSIMPKRVCHTQAEWDALEAAAASDMERLRNMDRSRAMVGAGR